MAYYCANLAGEHCYNTCINCDLTVSCNCNDAYGHGVLGSLKSESFESIWLGKTANKFRSQMFSGILPTPQCIGCYSLITTDEETAKSKVGKHGLPSGITIENGLACNFLCQCPRYSLPSFRKTTKLSKEDLEVAVKVCRDIGVKNIFYFNLNEPFCSPTIEEELLMVRKFNPNAWLLISTNASLINTESKRRAALLTDELICSIAGSSQKTVSRYQVNSNVETVLNNIRTVVSLKKETDSKTSIIWKYVAFPWNDSEKEIFDAVMLSKEIGFSRIEFCIGYVLEGPESNLFEKPFFRFLKTETRDLYRIIDYEKRIIL